MTAEKTDLPTSTKPAPKGKVVLIFIAALLAMAAMAIFRKKPPSIPWVQNYNEGVTKAQQQHKPLLLAFMGDTPNSNWMERDCHHSQPVVDFVIKAFVPIWIDGEKQPALTVKYNVTAYPTYVIIWPDGKIDSRIVAHSSPTVFIEKMQTGLERIGAGPQP